MMKTLLFALLVGQIFALEIDEKLTLRVLRTSDSRKTILVNRGSEDGVAKGDHAKFYLSTGVVARGVAIKSSPTRSVWSMYRLVNADFIRADQVMKLKATPAVKVTKDESRSLVDDDMVLVPKDPRELGIPLAKGADDLKGNELNSEEVIRKYEESLNISDKNWELFGRFSFDRLNSKTTTSEGGANYSYREQSTILEFGAEYYFKNEETWYSRFSLVGAMRINRVALMSFEGTGVEESRTLFGGGVNWYFWRRPYYVHTLIPFANASFLLGSTSSNISPGDSSSATSDTVSANTRVIILGGGVKYYTRKGYGALARLDYEMITDNFSSDSSGANWQKRTNGPRISLGFNYRF